jgi:hypothetical protein
MDLNTDKLPDFIVCGFQKCGTSALSQNLNQHSDISIARTSHVKANLSHGKEINFFAFEKMVTSTHYMGIDWYKRHFKNDGKLWGYCSPNYTSAWPHKVVELMSRHLKSTKFVFSIRNPIYRTFSTYNHYRQLLNENIKFGSWEVDKNFIYNVKYKSDNFCINYVDVLKLYENAFGRDKLHIMNQEKLYSTASQDEYNKLFNFLNVDKQVIKNNDCHSRYYNRGIKTEEIEYLKDLYVDQVNRLFDYLGYEIKEWKEFVK